MVRSISAPDTLGGGLVLDPHARRHGPRALFSNGSNASAAENRPRPRIPARKHAAARIRGGRPGACGARLSPEALALEQLLREAGARAPSEAELGDAARAVPELRAAGIAVRVGRSMYAHADTVAEVAERVRSIVGSEGSLTLARLRDELGISRRYAQALLEHLDAARLTRRLPDDTRVLRPGR